MHTVKIILFLSIVMVSSTTLAKAQQYESKPDEPSKQTDVDLQKKVYKVLNGNNQKLKEQMADTVLKYPDSFNPPVLYGLSHVLFEQGKKDEAAFWFYTGQLRARYDAQLSTDESAGQVVDDFNKRYGLKINRYTFKEPDNLKKIVDKAVAYVRNHEERYDHRWISLYGMDAMLSDLKREKNQQSLIKPKEDWPAIKKETIGGYYSGFLKYIKKAANRE